jgi:hypothetical protein
MSRLSLVGCLALAGTILFAARQAGASEIIIEHFSIPGDQTAFVYTSTTVGRFELPDQEGNITYTITLTDTAQLPTEEIIVGIWRLGWEQSVVITTTFPNDDTSWYTVVSDTTRPQMETYTEVHLDVDENEVMTVRFTNTPEPGTTALLGASALWLLCLVRRRRARR